MVEYYEMINHTNSSDSEEDVIELYSSKEEPKEVVEIHITKVTNAGILKAYIEREKIAEIPTEGLNIQNSLVIPVGAKIPEGQKFKITLQNIVSGTNAQVIGYIRYHIGT